jgi:methionine aminotransferase
MNQLAMEHNAINLAQGFPDFPADPRLIAYVNEAMKEGYNQYAPMGGIYSLREAIVEKMKPLYNASYDPDKEITVTVGATQAIFTTITAFVNPGDEVILFKPAYDCYEPAVKINGGVPIPIQMKGGSFHINWQEFKLAMGPKTRMVIINSPHNPSGTVLSATDLQELQHHLKGTNVLVLSDEAYEHLVYDEQSHESVAKYPDLASRSLLCASFGKTFHATGWKMGYCAAPAELMKEFRKIHEFNVFAVNHPVQRALAKYLRQPENYLGLPAFFQEKRDFFLDSVGGSRFNFTPAQGTYFQLLDYRNITDERDVDFAKRITKEYGLASIPISVFSEHYEDDRQLRFCFAKKKETLEKAGEILQRI